MRRKHGRHKRYSTRLVMVTREAMRHGGWCLPEGPEPGAFYDPCDNGAPQKPEELK